MTFEPIEVSRYQGRPATLYLFVYQGSLLDSPPTTSYFAYTDAEQVINFNGIDYQPFPILRDSINASGNLDKSALAIKIPKEAELSLLFRIYPPVQPVTLVIRQGHVNDVDQEFLVIWSGRILSIGREGNDCVISGEPISSSLRRPGLRRHYQIGCPHVLYGPQCRANEAAATVVATVASISGLFVTLDVGWEGAFLGEKFLEGMVKWTNDDGGLEIRKILKVTGDILLLGGYLRDLVATDTVSVILGCNHQHSAPGTGAIGDCGELHNNDQNYGGCKWIPVKNPVGLRNQYY